jgi:hypothetical protein
LSLVGTLRNLWLIAVISIVLILVFIGIASITHWNQTFIGLTLGVIIGFLPTFSLTILGYYRDWNKLNIEKIYAPLTDEIIDLQTYFSDTRKATPDLFEYDECRDDLLSMATWNKLSKKHMLYRLRLDDKKLSDDLYSFYFVLNFYIKNRTDFLEFTVNPLLNELIHKKDLNSNPAVLVKLRRAIINIILDRLEPNGEKIRLDFYANFTSLYADYECAKTVADIPDESFEEFLLRIKTRLSNSIYSGLLEQRRCLNRDLTLIRPKLEQKLRKALPV